MGPSWPAVLFRPRRSRFLDSSRSTRGHSIHPRQEALPGTLSGAGTPRIPKGQQIGCVSRRAQIASCWAGATGPLHGPGTLVLLLRAFPGALLPSALEALAGLSAGQTDALGARTPSKSPCLARELGLGLGLTLLPPCLLSQAYCAGLQLLKSVPRETPVMGVIPEPGRKPGLGCRRA